MSPAPALVDLALRLPVVLLPVLLFLGALVFLDSFKLLSPRLVIALLAAGVVAAGLGYYVNTALYRALDVEFLTYSRFVAPFVEEGLKAAVLIYLIRTRRVGLQVDAAIAGFAIGAGFALVENLFYLMSRPNAGIGVHLIRGFGTAIMHGGATALLGMVAVTLADRHPNRFLSVVMPGFLAAVALHMAYNFLLVRPVLATLLVLGGLPLTLYLVFQASERNLRDWLQADLDSDIEVLQLINDGRLMESHIGTFLNSLKSQFRGEALADMVCCVRLHVELGIRAKALLMMRELGMEPELDDEVRDQLRELRALEDSLGPTGRLAVRPLLAVTGKDLWQLRLLEK